MPEKIALITGSSSGFGLLTCVELAKAGFRVIATMRNITKRRLLDQAAAVAGVSDRIDVRVFDVTHFNTIAPFIEQVLRDYASIMAIQPRSDAAGTTTVVYDELDLPYGDLRVKSEPGKTVFTVVLPMTESGPYAPPNVD